MTAVGRISEFCFHWTIPDFFTKINDRETDSITSPDFEFSDSAWKITLYPNRQRDYLGLFLEKYWDALEKTAYFTLQLKNSTIVREAFRTFNVENGLDWGFVQFIRKSDVEDESNNIVTSGSATVICCMKEEQPVAAIEPQPPLKLSDLSKLSSDFEELYAQEKFCDVTLIVGDREFHAHKIVLVARSPVFAAMFAHGSAESQSGVVTIPDLDPDSFGAFLRFLYAGSMDELSFPDARRLYVTADKYDVQDLKSFCQECMMRQLTVHNICDAIRLAEQYEDAKLKDVARMFFKRKADDIIETDEWEELSKTQYSLTTRMLKGVLQSKRRCNCPED